jgi:hypothetical protein
MEPLSGVRRLRVCLNPIGRPASWQRSSSPLRNGDICQGAPYLPASAPVPPAKTGFKVSGIGTLVFAYDLDPDSVFTTPFRIRIDATGVNVAVEVSSVPS